MNTFEALGVFKAKLIYSNPHYRVVAPTGLLDTLFVAKAPWKSWSFPSSLPSPSPVPDIPIRFRGECLH